MKTRRMVVISLGTLLVVVLTAGCVVAVRSWRETVHRTHLVAYFDNSNGIFAGDDVRMMGVTVGKIDTVEPQPLRAKISFWVDAKYQIPAEAKAVILSPSLVTARAIQLTPAYTGGPTLADNDVIPQSRTAVPVEFDDLRAQLERLTNYLQPTQPGGVSTLGALVNTAADNLRGEGGNIRDTVIKLSQAFSTLGDHSTDIFSTVKQLAALVSGLQSSTDLMQQLNRNLATVTDLLANDPGEVARAVADLNSAVADVRGFVAENKDVIGTTGEQLSALSQTLVESLDDIKQTLHITPNTFSNFSNTFRPASGESAIAIVYNNFANPISFICGAIQAASRLNAEQSAKLCVQYLAPIVKNRQYNFPPIGTTIGLFEFPVSGAMARPNEITYSEDWMRPDHVPSPPAQPQQPGPQHTAPGSESPPAPPQAPPPLAAEVPVATDPSKGLTGMMVPSGGGS